MHRLDLGLYSHPKEFLGGMEFEPMLTPREKSPLPENVPRGDVLNRFNLSNLIWGRGLGWG